MNIPVLSWGGVEHLPKQILHIQSNHITLVRSSTAFSGWALFVCAKKNSTVENGRPCCNHQGPFVFPKRPTNLWWDFSGSIILRFFQLLTPSEFHFFFGRLDFRVDLHTELHMPRFVFSLNRMVPKNARSSHWHFSLPNPGSSDWQWIFHMVEAWHIYQTPLHNLPGNYLKQVNLLKIFRAGWVLGVIWSQIVLPKTIRLEPKLSRKLTAKAPEDPQIWKSGTSSSNQISILVGVPNLSFSGGWKMISKLGESPIFKGWKNSGSSCWEKFIPYLDGIACSLVFLGQGFEWCTLPKTNSAFTPETWWLEDDRFLSFWDWAFFSGANMLVLRRVSCLGT